MPDHVVERCQDRVVVTLAGDLTAASVPGLQADLKGALGPGVAEVTFDLGATSVLDSSGIGLLIATANSAARLGGRVQVGRVSADIHQLLQGMRLVARLNVTGRPEQGASRG